MPVTDYKRFQTKVDDGGWDLGTGAESLLEGASDALVIAVENSTLDLPYAILKDPVDFGVPSNATITGIELNITIGANNFSNLTSNQVWNGELATTDLSEGDLIRELISIPPGDSNTQAVNFLVGGDGNLLGLSLVPSKLNRIQLGFKLATLGKSSVTTGVYGEQGDGVGAFAIPSPAVRIYYTTPDVSFKSGPNFMSSNVDLTKFRGLGDKISPLATSPSSEDLFGFTSVIVPETDNSNQATDSVFGDAANFGKLGKNRGGGTGISSNTGLLDASKAPLSVRKGFRGL